MSLINVSNLTFAYEGSYDNIFENVSFQIDTDWKLGFTGRNGRGKTTFLCQFIFGTRFVIRFTHSSPAWISGTNPLPKS
jgi:ABC-type Mn2+/Zn2+ transport system ATPase subunit